MEDRLRGLKKAMTNHTFVNVELSEEKKEQIKLQCAVNLEMELFPLLTSYKSATDVIQQLHVKNVQSISLNEGTVFTALHLAEAKGEVMSMWNEQGQKLYKLSEKGVALYIVEPPTSKLRSILKNIWTMETRDER